jgi:hypothetical protein
MQKIPVGQTIGQAYAFAFGKYLPILGVLWLPFLLLAVVGYFVMAPMFHVWWDFVSYIMQHPGAKEPPPFAMMQQVQQFQARALAFDVLELAVLSVVSVGVVKEAMGLRRGLRLFYAGSGLEELLVAGAYFFLAILLGLALLIAAVGVVIIVLILGAALGSHVDKATAAAQLGGLGVLAGLILACGFVYATVRLAFFIVPVTVAEREFGVFRSWELTKGNFWRIFAILFVSWVPVVIVVDGLFFGVLGFSILPAVIAEAHKHAPHDPAAVQAVLNVVWEGLKRSWPYLVAISVLPAPILYGLLFGPAAFAYRALIPAQPVATGTTSA